MIVLPFCEVKWGLQRVSTKWKNFIFYLLKRKKKNKANIDVNKTTISVRSQNPYKFPLIKSSILFILICKLFTTLIFICSNHASSHLFSKTYYISRIHPLVLSKCSSPHHNWLQAYYLLHTHRKSPWSLRTKNSSRNLWSSKEQD